MGKDKKITLRNKLANKIDDEVNKIYTGIKHELR